MSASDDAGEGFVGTEAKGVLAEDGALIEIRCDEVGGHAENFHAFVVGLTVGGGAREGGKKGGMNVKNSIFPVPNEVGGKNFHKAGEHDEFNIGFF